MTKSALRIPYESEGFPAGTITNGSHSLSVTWDEILWAALTVGRPNRHYVFQHGSASMYEALFRLSLVRMALEQRGPHGSRIRQTAAAKTMDPSEKGAVSYFLGLTFCKLFAVKLLDTPWLLHLDVFRPGLDPVLTGRSRPDLVGQERLSSKWHAFECKGRISAPDSKSKAKAKNQAQRLVSVESIPCTLHIGAFTFLRGGALEFYWRDPPPASLEVIELPSGRGEWRHYYEPLAEVLRIQNRASRVDQEVLVSVEGLDIQIGFHMEIARALFARNWVGARNAAREMAEDLRLTGYQSDGIKVIAGSSWSERYEDSLEG